MSPKVADTGIIIRENTEVRTCLISASPMPIFSTIYLPLGGPITSDVTNLPALTSEMSASLKIPPRKTSLCAEIRITSFDRVNRICFLELCVSNMMH